jgi:poly(A) polymerase
VLTLELLCESLALAFMKPSRITKSAAATLASKSLQNYAPFATELAQRFAKSNYRLALVGGSVRDAILNRFNSVKQMDLDFTTNAKPAETKEILTKWADSIWETGARFGTIAANKNGINIEITTYRSESYKPDSRNPQVNFGEEISVDLKRRDFTINAMALELTTPTPEFIDLYEGLIDLENRLIKTPTSATESFDDDPLRMLRAARFASQLGFSVTPEIVKAITDMSDRISIISAERVRDELTKLIMSDKPRLGLTLIVETKLAEKILPEIPKLKLEIDEHHHHKDVYEHTLTVLEQAISLENRLSGPNLILRLAALMHDVGKPKTRVLSGDGRVSFHHHEVVGARITKERLSKLRFDSDVIEKVSKLVYLHLRFHGYGDGEWTDSAVRRYVRDAGELLDHLHVLTRADCTTRNVKKAAKLAKTYDQLEARIAQLREQEELDQIRPDLDGNQIMQILQIKPSKSVGLAYEYLLELRLENGPLGEERATKELLSWWSLNQPKT